VIGFGIGIPSETDKVTYRCTEDLSADVLSQSLRRIAIFIQDLDPYAILRTHYDWRQHGVSGSPFANEKPSSIHNLFLTVGSPKELLRASSDDDRVFVGFAPDDNSWYLRFRLEWDDEGFNLVGRFDLTLPKEAVANFRTGVLPDLPAAIEELDESEYSSEVGSNPGQI
jgi:hypothetical protein